MKDEARILRCFTIDMTYGFQEHGIVIAEEPNDMWADLDCTPSEEEERSNQSRICGERCRFYHLCAKQRDISWTGLTWSRVQEVFPQELKFDKVIGSHSGQCGIDEIFKTWNFSDQIAAYGFSQNAALCLKHSGDAITWCSMELEYRLDEKDVCCMQKLARLLKECLHRPVYLCTNSRHPYLIPFSDTEKLSKFMKG